MPTWKGTEVPRSCVQCFLYLVSPSINISIFHKKIKNERYECWPRLSGNQQASSLFFFDFFIALHSILSQVLSELTSGPGFLIKIVVATDVPIASLSCRLHPAPTSYCPSAYCCQWPGHMPSFSLASAFQSGALPSHLRSLCSMYPCLWSYFVCQLILFIRFHIEVKSYGIGLSLTGLLHLA